LNDTHLCVPSGSESYKENVKNPHADALFKVEDDQLEVDILLGRCTSAIEALKRLVQHCETLPQAEKVELPNFIQGTQKEIFLKSRPAFNFV